MQNLEIVTGLEFSFNKPIYNQLKSEYEFYEGYEFIEEMFNNKCQELNIIGLDKKTLKLKIKKLLNKYDKFFENQYNRNIAF